MATHGRTYHDGERRVQERAGVVDMADRIAGGIHPMVPPRAAAFLAERTLLVLGVADSDGRPWASVVTGPAGFLRVPDPTTLAVAASVAPDDPAAGGIRAGAPVGTLAIDFSTRRRARVNGVVRTVSPRGVILDVQQAYANCPKYIQQRAAPADDAVAPAADPAARGTALTPDQVDAVRRADTFFVATVAPDHGADASHRGGRPGFVQASADALVWPDYAGNSMFNTLGNIEADGRTGLAFIDFGSGTLLQVSGSASIDWDPAAVEAVPGAERLVRLRVERVVERRHVLPGGWTLEGLSPFNPPV